MSRVSVAAGNHPTDWGAISGGNRNARSVVLDILHFISVERGEKLDILCSNNYQRCKVCYGYDGELK